MKLCTSNTIVLGKYVKFSRDGKSEYVSLPSDTITERGYHIALTHFETSVTYDYVYL